MERDPVRFVWRHARGPNALIVALAILVLVPGIWVVCEVIRTAIDDVLPDRAGVTCAVNRCVKCERGIGRPELDVHRRDLV